MSFAHRPVVCRKLALTLVLLLCLSGSVWPQITIQGDPSGKNSIPSSGQNTGQVRVDFYMTPEESAKLLAAVDEIIALDSKITGLSVRGHVQGQITDRNQIKQLSEQRLKDDDVVQRMQRSSLVLQKFGFIPRDFDLGRFATQTSVDELAGYYDPRVKTMYLLNWLPLQAQQPVMAHELDHALQDQNFGLETWMKIQEAGDKNLSEAELNERRAVRRAVAEGHATAVMMDYALAPYGKSLVQLPALPSDFIQKSFDRYSSLSLQNAPLMLREAAMFPYVYGFTFIHQVLLKGGKDRAYAGVFKNPPWSTRQIMEPETYLSGEKLAPLQVPELEPVLGPGYQKLEDGIMGEFDSMVFVKQFGSSEQARQLTPQWRGGYYYAAQRGAKSDPSDGKPAAATSQLSLGTKDVGLLYISRWASAGAAHDFAEVYRASIERRYPGAQAQLSATQAGAHEEFAHWDSSEGTILLQVNGNQVVVLESFDPSTASKLLSLLK